MSEPNSEQEKWLFGDEMRAEAQEMLSRSWDTRTICNVIRYLHSLCTTKEQKYLCQEIIWMAKKMDSKLQFYKKDWDKGIWVQGDKKGENTIIT